MEEQAFFGLHIGVLDDNPFYTSLYKFQLERELKTHYKRHQEHFQIRAFTDTKEFIENLPALFSVSFVDYHLGNSWTGIDVMQRIKAKNNQAKVYIVTDESNSFILRSCVDAGADGIIFKNNELMELSLMVIENTLSDNHFPYRFNHY
jgi:CheY-like chemotaxis protein